jgi:formylglycine-generating enzyme
MKKYVFLILAFWGCDTWKIQEKQPLLLPEMISVKGGSFEMGSNDGFADERPTHLVQIDDFEIGKFEITVKQYKEFCLATNRTFPANPIWNWKDNHPIVFVNFNDANEYCIWLGKLLNMKIRLPTEAEWEFAAKGGIMTKNYKYAGSNIPEEVAWFGGNTNLITQETRPVGQKKSNEIGLFDMSGNVWEWCSDWYGNYTSSTQTNPKGASSGSKKCMRGGSWFDYVTYMRTSARYPFDPDGIYYQVGFRIVREK